MFTIGFEQPRNFLVLRDSDHVGPAEADRALEEMRFALEAEERGFRRLAGRHNC